MWCECKGNMSKIVCHRHAYNDQLFIIVEIFPMAFDGGKLTINKGLSNHFQVNHNFTLGTMQPSGYKFGATYVGSKQLSQSEVCMHI